LTDDSFRQCFTHIVVANVLANRLKNHKPINTLWTTNLLRKSIFDKQWWQLKLCTILSEDLGKKDGATQTYYDKIFFFYSNGFYLYMMSSLVILVLIKR
jgi:hypothetical protein